MSWAAHTIDHIIAEKHGGSTDSENVALACTLCDVRKGSDLASIDEMNGSVVPLFNPRRDHWRDHFQLLGGRIEPLTPTGRATTRLLHFNDQDRIRERELFVAAGVKNMATDTKGVLEIVLALPAIDRAALVDSLLASLDEPDASIDNAWAAEAETRLTAFDAGQIKAVPSEIVFAELGDL
jgi:putative addiction module component (TIGR02574 family)